MKNKWFFNWQFGLLIFSFTMIIAIPNWTLWYTVGAFCASITMSVIAGFDSRLRITIKQTK